MIDITELIDRCTNSNGFLFKYVSANDAGKTGSHQAGLYMPRDAWRLFLDREGRKGENIDRNVTIFWDNGQDTESRFIWYGQGTRSEYRLTRGITFLEPENVGDLIVIIKKEEGVYWGYLLDTDESIDEFFSAFDLSPVDSCKAIFLRDNSQVNYFKDFNAWLGQLKVEFPESRVISDFARVTYQKYNRQTNYDTSLVNWIDTEYQLFKFIENNRYAEYLNIPFASIPELIEVANKILNRRKSRAGHSLENHLGYIFMSERIPFSSQGYTEKKKRPDFIFPDISSYHDKNFAADEITFLAAKTTCKDRWRQILSEAARVERKYLLTLQQGISKNQLDEMEGEKVTLVVPSIYHKYFPEEYRTRILSVSHFVELLKEKYSS